MRQEVRFCTSADGVRLAYAIHGKGPPLVRTATWLTDLEFDWESPVWRHWLHGLGDGRTVLRYDERGCGLSDRDVEDFSLDARISDLEAVIDASGFDRVTLLGISHGGPLAIAYAARHPERVGRLVLYATFARGRLMRGASPADREQAQLMTSLIRMGWGQGQPAFRRLFTTLFIPDANPAQMEWFDQLQRVTAEPETAVRIRDARNHDDVTHEATQVECPTLVLHAREDALVPYAEGRLLATLIPHARFVALESRNHILLADEPAWAQFRAQLDDFTGPGYVAPAELPNLSNREAELLALVAEGLSNDEIAARLHLSVRTVERHVTNLYGKLGLAGKAARAAAAVRFSRRGEAPEPDRERPVRPAGETGVGSGRVLTTVLFTDIVDSTGRAAELGDDGWRRLLADYLAAVRDQIRRFRGREVDTAGDGVLVAFDGAARAVHCAAAVREQVRRLGLEVRSGIHAGECEESGGKLVGIAVHIGARVLATAQPGEILVSSTVRELVAGSGITFEDRGEHRLKGISGERHLYAAFG